MNSQMYPQEQNETRFGRRHEYQEMNEIELTELHSTVGENQLTPTKTNQMAKY